MLNSVVHCYIIFHHSVLPRILFEGVVGWSGGGDSHAKFRRHTPYVTKEIMMPNPEVLMARLSLNKVLASALDGDDDSDDFGH